MRSIFLLTMMMLAGCAATVAPTASAPPPPTYHGPEYLRGAIGSMTTVRGLEPTLVAGYGLVTHLNHTGSPDVPPELRQWMLEELAKRGFGQHLSGYAHLQPAEVLASDTTAVVLVEGVIPVGAVEGDRFDLMVSALPQTQTTSLENGVLYTTELRMGGARLAPSAIRSFASGRGWVFINPFVEGGAPGSETTPGLGNPAKLVGHIPAGGMVTEASPLALVTQQPSYRLTRQIADRINGRYTRPGEPPIAEPKSDSIIELRVSERFRGQPRLLLNLINHLFLNPTTQFAQSKAAELVEMIKDPAHHVQADAIAMTWEGLGASVLPIIRPLYEDDQLVVRLTALNAGARLEDTKAGAPLYEIARANHGQPSEQATAMLAELLRQRSDNSPVRSMLRKLLDAEDVRVRLAAFEGLRAAGDTSIRQWPFADKLELAIVDSQKPLIHVTREGRPRVTIFGAELGFRMPLLLSAWGGQFLMREGSEGSSNKLAVYYKPPDAPAPITAEIPATVPHLVGTMAFAPDRNADNPSPGFDMSYSQIVHVLHQLTREGHVAAPLMLQPSDLVDRIGRGRIANAARSRPETDEGPAATPDDLPGTPPAVPGVPGVAP